MHRNALMEDIRNFRLFDNRFGDLSISELKRPLLVADAVQVFVLCDRTDTPRAVLHLSPAVDPDEVQRAMAHAREAKAHLAGRAGAVVLEPLAEGRVAGLSYAASSYCNVLTRHRPFSWMQRTLLRPRMCEWLRDVLRSTRSEVTPQELQTGFVEPMSGLATNQAVGPALRADAERALKRLASGDWRPRHVLMHGDLWRGNLMIRAATKPLEWWPDRVIVIDWASSLLRGYAFYDLVCIAESLKMPTPMLQREVLAHCEMLQCDITDARSYLAAALAHLNDHLGCFQLERYVELTEKCLETLTRALPL